MSDYLTDMHVTQAELEELQSNWTAFGGLTQRKKEILRAALANEDVMQGKGTQSNVFDFVNGWGKPLGSKRPWDNVCYRLRSDLRLPEKPSRPSDSKQPFRWEWKGREVWACPVFVAGWRLTFVVPHYQKTTWGMPVSDAASVVGFLGCHGVDWEGMPDGSGWPDVSQCLRLHHSKVATFRLAYVLYEIEEDDE